MSYGLWEHLHRCNCLVQSRSSICKHIRKVHSLLSRNTTVDNKETLDTDDPMQELEHRLFGTNQMEQEKMEEIESPQSSETDKYN